MRKRILAILIALIVPLVAVVPAAAVTDGVEDGDGHPMVGLMVALDADNVPLWRCSGTLLSPTVYLTAGHCTEPPAVRAKIWFAEGPILSGDYPFDEVPYPPCDGYQGYPCVGEVSGTTYTHPDYDPDAFYLHDAGVVVLDEPVTNIEVFGALPIKPGQYDDLRSGQKNGDYFTSVGYGLQESFPDQSSYDAHNYKTRMVAEPFLLNINSPGMTGSFSMLLSNNNVTGGTCYGDSGGPNFLQGTYEIAGITSFGMNVHCAGTGGVFRTDQEDVLSFVCSFDDGTIEGCD